MKFNNKLLIGVANRMRQLLKPMPLHRSKATHGTTQLEELFRQVQRLSAELARLWTVSIAKLPRSTQSHQKGALC